MEHYVTIFDSLFLPQGLALHASMERHAGEYTLWILCVDEVAFDVLDRVALRNVRLIALRNVETPELLTVKPGRSRGEYCWTLTPFAPLFVFDADATVRRVTYVDADVWLRKNPAAIFGELAASGKSVLITDHGYAPEYDQTATSGQYCVQFMTFLREKSEPVRKWWADRCIEWCFGRVEDGKFGDQKYLDDWAERFPDEIHVLSNKELTLAPWNATRFPYSGGVIWHFHGLRLTKIGNRALQADLGSYPLPDCARRYVYEPYLDDLLQASVILERHGYWPRPQKVLKTRTRFKIKLFGLHSNRYVKRWL